MGRRSLSSRVELGALAVLIAAVWWLIAAPSSLGGPLTAIVVRGTSMSPGIHSGDLVLTTSHISAASGNTIAFRVHDNVVVHRAVAESAEGWTTRGDSLDAPDPWLVAPDAVLGTQVVRIPGGGRWVAAMTSPLVLGMAAGAAAAVAVAMATDRELAAVGDWGLRHERTVVVAVAVVMLVGLGVTVARAASLVVTTGGVASWSSSLTALDVINGIHLP